MGNKCTTATESCGFQCTNYDGSDIWAERMAITEKISCDTCRPHAIANESGYHDHVNAGIGDDVYDEKNYLRFADEVACVKKSYCQRTGRC